MGIGIIFRGGLQNNGLKQKNTAATSETLQKMNSSGTFILSLLTSFTVVIIALS